MEVGVEKINSILENFLGINDSELATQIWDKSEGKDNSMDFAEAIDNSDLEEFGFTDELVIELWGVITDARSGRLNAAKWGGWACVKTASQYLLNTCADSCLRLKCLKVMLVEPSTAD